MLKPIRDNVVLEIIEQEAVSQGGILIPGSALEKPYQGRVVAANRSFAMPDGSIKECEVAVGDVVYFGKTHGTEVKTGGKSYLVIAEEFILCKE